MRTPLTLIDAVDAMVAQKHTVGYKYEAEEAILDRFVAFTHRQFPGLETITDASANAWIEAAQKRAVTPSTLRGLTSPVRHLSQIASRFQQEKIDLVVLDQNIDTRTSTGCLMFNILASIAEFENDLRSERQAEGIAKENGVRFGRPAKLTESLRQDIYFRRQSGDTIGQLAKEFSLGEATIYRVLKTFKPGNSS